MLLTTSRGSSRRARHLPSRKSSIGLCKSVWRLIMFISAKSSTEILRPRTYSWQEAGQSKLAISASPKSWSRQLSVRWQWWEPLTIWHPRLAKVSPTPQRQMFGLWALSCTSCARLNNLSLLTIYLALFLKLCKTSQNLFPAPTALSCKNWSPCSWKKIRVNDLQRPRFSRCPMCANECSNLLKTKS